MPRLILSTCGISLLTNYAGEHRRLITDAANAKTPNDLSEEACRDLAKLVENVQQELPALSALQQAEKSAELHGLLRFYGGRLNRDRDTHWLIASDTWLGEATAIAIARVLKDAGHTVEIKRITDLRTDDLSAFHSAMSDLARLCATEVRGYRDQQWPVIFNLTGGFKGVQGFMQVLSMLYADESIYVFEHTDELLRIPRLPITLDSFGLLRRHENLFRRLHSGLPVEANAARALPESLVLEVDGQAVLSVWGDVVWAEASDTLLRERLWPPVTGTLRYGERFERSVATQCDATRLHILNERLLQLSRHLETTGYNPASLDFKALRGRHHSWTHECDAWSDLDAKRIFGHFEDNVFVLDALGPHL